MQAVPGFLVPAYWIPGPQCLPPPHPWYIQCIDGLSYFSDLVAVPQRVLPDTETAEDTVHTDLEFLDDPDRAEEDAVPRVMYKPNSDEEEAAYNFEPGKVFNRDHWLVITLQKVYMVPPGLNFILYTLPPPIRFFLYFKCKNGEFCLDKTLQLMGGANQSGMALSGDKVLLYGIFYR